MVYVFRLPSDATRRQLHRLGEASRFDAFPPARFAEWYHFQDLSQPDEAGVRNSRGNKSPDETGWWNCNLHKNSLVKIKPKNLMCRLRTPLVRYLHFDGINNRRVRFGWFLPPCRIELLDVIRV